MDTNIQFEDNEPVIPAEQYSGMIGWLIRKDIVSTKGQATLVLLSLVIILLLLTLIVIVLMRTDGSAQYNPAIYVDPDQDIL